MEGVGALKHIKITSALLAAIIIISSALVPSSVLSESRAAAKQSGVSSVAAKYESEVPVVIPANDLTYTVRAGRAVISKYNGNETKVIIPSELGGVPVYSIVGRAFADNSALTYIKLPSTLAVISTVAFNLCDSLTKIEVDAANEKFTSVDGVLYTKDMTRLVCFPGGRTGAFTIPKSVTTVGGYAFDHCYGLTSVNMYNGVKDIAAHAFSFCWNMEKIRLSDSLLTLGAYALSNCDDLEEIHLPASLTAIGENAVLGFSDSYGYKQYYFVDGIYCVKGTYAETYIKTLGVSYIREFRTITDIDTGVVIYDTDNKLPAGVGVAVSSLSVSDLGSAVNGRKYNKLYAYDVSLTKDGAAYSLPGNIYLNIVFNGLDADTITTASKVYKISSGFSQPINRAPESELIYARTNKLGVFAVLCNNDFSLPGDVDGDGEITLYDAKTVLCASLGLLVFTDEQFTAANVVDSSVRKITTEDARRILRVAAEIDKF